MGATTNSSRVLFALAASVAITAASVPDVAQASQPAEASPPDKETMAKAKKLFIEGEKAFAKEDFATAATKYEQAYYLLPDKHGFAYKVGISAWKSGNCPTAYTYFRHFLQYETDTEGKADQIDEAKRILGEIAVQECAGEAAAGGAASGDPNEPVTGDEPDLSRDAPGMDDGVDEEPADKKKAPVLLIGGTTALVIGVAGLGMGIGTRVVASNNADELSNLASRNTTSGFAEGDYSDASTRDLESSLPTLNALSVTGFVVGGVGIAAGGALIALHFVKKGKAEKAGDEGEPAATARRIRQPVVTPTFSRDGGGASFSMRF